MEIQAEPFQFKFLNSTKRYPALISGIGTGKTFFLLLKIWKFCQDYDDTLALIVRKEFTDLRDSTLKDFERYFGVTVDGNKEYRFQNGSCIMFRHGDELNVLKNINLSIIGIEQAEEFIDDETFTFLRDRLRRDNAPYRQLCVIGNTNGHNWIWRLWKDNPSSEEFELNEATTFDNAVNLPKDFTEDLKCMEFDNPAHYAQYVMNSWEDIGERLYYPMFSRNLHIVPYDRIAQKLTVFNILDPHDRKFWCMAWIGIDKTGTSYVIDEYPDFPFDPKATGNKTYSDYKDIIRQKDEVVRSMFNCHIERRYIDPNFGNKTIQLAEKQGGQSVTTPKKILLEMGLQYFDAIDALQAGHMKVAESLRYEKIANEIVKQPSIFVLDNCKNTIEHLSHYSGKNPVTRDGDVKDVVMPLERYKDFADLVRYYLMANPKFNDNVIDNDVEISHYRRHL